MATQDTINKALDILDRAIANIGTKSLMDTITEARKASRISYLPVAHLRDAYQGDRFDAELTELVKNDKVWIHEHDRPNPSDNEVFRFAGRIFGCVSIR